MQDAKVNYFGASDRGLKVAFQALLGHDRLPLLWMRSPADHRVAVTLSSSR